MDPVSTPKGRRTNLDQVSQNLSMRPLSNWIRCPQCRTSKVCDSLSLSLTFFQTQIVFLPSFFPLWLRKWQWPNWGEFSPLYSCVFWLFLIPLLLRFRDFCCGPGSTDPCLMHPDPAPGPVIFVIDLQDANKKQFFFFKFSVFYFLNVHLHHFSRIKRHTKITKQLESRIFLLFLLDDGRIRIRIRTSG
jgi:hypothetical protein